MRERLKKLIDETCYSIKTAWEGELTSPSSVFEAHGKAKP
jgi:hypothetical protein